MSYLGRSLRDAQSQARTCSYYATLRQCPRTINLRTTRCCFRMFLYLRVMDRKSNRKWMRAEGQLKCHCLHLHLYCLYFYNSSGHKRHIEPVHWEIICVCEKVSYKNTQALINMIGGWVQKVELVGSGWRNEGGWESHYNNYHIIIWMMEAGRGEGKINKLLGKHTVEKHKGSSFQGKVRKTEKKWVKVLIKQRHGLSSPLDYSFHWRQ